MESVRLTPLLLAVLIILAGCASTETTTNQSGTTTVWTPNDEALPPYSVEENPGPTNVSFRGNKSLNSTRIEHLIHQKVNAYRENHSRDPLTHNRKYIAPVARAHSYDMWNRSFFAHRNPDGDMPFDRYKNTAYQYKECSGFSENIFYVKYGSVINIKNGSQNPVAITTNERVASAAVHWWINSKPHRKNMLRPVWDSAGVGVFIKDGYVYVTHNFCNHMTEGTTVTET